MVMLNLKLTIIKLVNSKQSEMMSIEETYSTPWRKYSLSCAAQTNIGVGGFDKL